MKYLALVCGFLCLSVAAAADVASRAEYVGGTVSSIPQRARGSVSTTDADCVRFELGRGDFTVPYSRVNLLEYGQKVDRRYLLGIFVSPVFLLSKKRQHFLTIGWSDDQGLQQALVLKVDKNDIRALLAGLEARTGRRIAFQDENARKAGRG